MKIIFVVILLVMSVKISTSAQDIHLVNDYKNISSASQLFAQFKGQTVFLDLWAPWCEPCKEEFKYSDSLYCQLKKRNITMLYVSLNVNVIEKEWKSDIDTFKLKGFHVLASKDLEDSLTNLIWGHPGGFSIPRYLLINKTGEILINDVLSPDNGAKLYEQIDQALKK